MRNINPFGVLIIVVGVLSSYGISVYQGLQMSSVWWMTGIWVLIGATAVTWEMIGWHRAAHLLRERRLTAFGMNAAGLALASCVTIVLFELAFLATGLESVASKNAATIDNAAALRSERSALQASIAAGGTARGVAAIDAEIAGIKTHPRWASTHGCDPEWTTAKESKALCESYSAALVERGRAVSFDRATARIHEITATLTPMATVGVADARSLYISHIFGTSEQAARIIVGTLVILFLYFSRAVAGFVFVDPKTDGDTQDAIDGDTDYSYDDEDDYGYTDANVVPIQGQTEVERLEAQLANLDEAIRQLEATPIDGDGVRPDYGDTEAASDDEMATGGVAMATPNSVVEMGSRRLGTETSKNQIARFATECVLIDEEGYVTARAMRKAYESWARENNLPIANITVFGVVMTSLVENLPGGAKDRSGDRRYKGVRLKPKSAKLVSTRTPTIINTPSTEKVLGPMVRRLGLDGKGFAGAK